MGKRAAKKRQIRRRSTESPSPPPAKSIRSGRRLSDELIEQCILPFLPVSSLLRFQFVSTRWHDLIVDPYFVLLHSRIHSSPPPSLLLYTKIGRGPTARFLDPETRRPSFRRRIYDQFGYEAGSVVASCSGLVCILCDDHGKQKLVVGNPILRDWKLIPYPPSLHEFINYSYGLVVDMGESDVTCKLVLFGRTQINGTGFDQLFHVFTSSTGLWERIQERFELPSYMDVWPTPRNVAYVRGILYSLCTKDYLLWFDPKENRSGFEALPLPRTTIAWSGCFFETFSAFGEWNGDLSYTKACALVDVIEIWSMTDHRKPCWTKRHSLCVNTIFRENLCFAGFDMVRMVTAELMPFGGGNLMFVIEGMLYSYNLKSGQAHNLLKGSRFDSYYRISYQRSLVIWSNREELSPPFFASSVERKGRWNRSTCLRETC